ncbi:MAG: hypothetical protein U9P70_04475 [Patescibacteria group bacterium]|nr:hypothetical protein [Patescibacteria group bacterium]
MSIEGEKSFYDFHKERLTKEKTGNEVYDNSRYLPKNKLDSVNRNTTKEVVDEQREEALQNLKLALEAKEIPEEERMDYMQRLFDKLNGETNEGMIDLAQGEIMEDVLDRAKEIELGNTEIDSSKEKYWNNLKEEIYGQLYEKTKEKLEEATNKEAYIGKMRNNIKNLPRPGSEDKRFLDEFGFSEKDEEDQNKMLELYKEIGSKILDDIVKENIDKSEAVKIEEEKKTEEIEKLAEELRVINFEDLTTDEIEGTMEKIGIYFDKMKMRDIDINNKDLIARVSDIKIELAEYNKKMKRILNDRRQEERNKLQEVEKVTGEIRTETDTVAKVEKETGIENIDEYFKDCKKNRVKLRAGAGQEKTFIITSISPKGNTIRLENTKEGNVKTSNINKEYLYKFNNVKVDREDLVNLKKTIEENRSLFDDKGLNSFAIEGTIGTFLEDNGDAKDVNEIDISDDSAVINALEIVKENDELKKQKEAEMEVSNALVTVFEKPLESLENGGEINNLEEEIEKYKNILDMLKDKLGSYSDEDFENREKFEGFIEKLEKLIGLMSELLELKKKGDEVGIKVKKLEISNLVAELKKRKKEIEVLGLGRGSDEISDKTGDEDGTEIPEENLQEQLEQLKAKYRKAEEDNDREEMGYIAGEIRTLTAEIDDKTGDEGLVRGSDGGKPKPGGGPEPEPKPESEPVRFELNKAEEEYIRKSKEIERLREENEDILFIPEEDLTDEERKIVDRIEELEIGRILDKGSGLLTNHVDELERKIGTSRKEGILEAQKEYIEMKKVLIGVEMLKKGLKMKIERSKSKRKRKIFSSVGKFSSTIDNFIKKGERKIPFRNKKKQEAISGVNENYSSKKRKDLDSISERDLIIEFEKVQRDINDLDSNSDKKTKEIMQNTCVINIRGVLDDIKTRDDIKDDHQDFKDFFENRRKEIEKLPKNLNNPKEYLLKMFDKAEGIFKEKIADSEGTPDIDNNEEQFNNLKDSIKKDLGELKEEELKNLKDLIYGAEISRQISDNTDINELNELIVKLQSHAYSLEIKDITDWIGKYKGENGATEIKLKDIKEFIDNINNGNKK